MLQSDSRDFQWLEKEVPLSYFEVKIGEIDVNLSYFLFQVFHFLSKTIDFKWGKIPRINLFRKNSIDEIFLRVLVEIEASVRHFTVKNEPA